MSDRQCGPFGNGLRMDGALSRQELAKAVSVCAHAPMRTGEVPSREARAARR